MMILPTGSADAKIEGERIVLSIPSGSVPVEISLTLNQAMKLSQRVKGAAMEAFNGQGMPQEAEVISFPGGRAAWLALVEKYETIDAIPLDETTDDMIDQAGDLISQIMAMPAPDAEAAKWKLDYILDTKGGSNACYTAEYIAQMKADYHRFLGEVGHD